MSTDRDERALRLFEAAIERKPEDRAAFVAEACGHDPTLQAEVESLLAVRTQSKSFLESPAMGAGFHVARGKSIRCLV